MQFPYKIIDSEISNRIQFHQIEGYQPTHALFYLKKGRFTIEINGKKEEIGEHDCVLLPNYIYFRRNVSNPIEFVYVKFSNNSNCPYSFPIPFGKVKPKDKKRFITNIESIEKCIEAENALSVGYCEHLLLDILFQIFYEQLPDQSISEEYTCRDALVSATIEHIILHIEQKLLVEDICHEMCTNPSTLNFKFRRELGLSIGQFIARERIKKAKRLLTRTTYSISQIATKCGFENVYYFSNFFKKHTGIFPSKYRLGDI